MARYDVYRNAVDAEGLLLDVQANLLEDLRTRVVVPLLPKSASFKPIDRLNPSLVIEAREYVAATQLMAAVSADRLGEPIANMTHLHDAIIRAIDILFSGI